MTHEDAQKEKMWAKHNSQFKGRGPFLNGCGS